MHQPADNMGQVMKRALLLIGMGIGAALMYALDPQQGNRRRAVARDKLTKAAHKTGRAVGATSRDVVHRASGLAASVHSRFFDQEAPDEVVEARVRARLGRVSRHPGAIEVTAHDGAITLTGPALGSEVQEIVRTISSVRGVVSVDNRLQPHETSEHLPALQGGSTRRIQEAHRGWSQSTRLVVGMAGAVLGAFGLARRDRPGILLGGIGIALVARAASDLRVEQFADLVSRFQSAEGNGVSIPVKFGPAPGSSPFASRPIHTSDRVH